LRSLEAFWCWGLSIPHGLKLVAQGMIGLYKQMRDTQSQVLRSCNSLPNIQESVPYPIINLKELARRNDTEFSLPSQMNSSLTENPVV
jgi:hypothetical protein